MTDPIDQPARNRIATDLEANLFVEAGAGAGKTSSLVGRIVALVQSGVDIGSIAAITFTEKAAAELRHRLRGELARAGEDDAVAALDHAPIGTLHAFARRLLNDFPIAAELPPGFTVLDELESQLAFTERWDTLIDRLLDDPEPEGGVVAGGSELVELCQLDNFRLESGGRRLAISFHENWDLVEARVDRDDPGPWRLDAEPFFHRVLALCDTPVPDDDKQAGRLAELRSAATAGLRTDRLGERVARLVELEDRCEKVKRCGSKTTWKQAGFDPEQLETLRADQLALAADARELLSVVRERRRQVLGAVFGRWVLEAAEERAAAGTLEFHDLLVLARRLVARNADIRRVLHDRYCRILLDEFQDTDPIQLEIAVRLSAAPDDPAHDTDWRGLRPLPGRLFIVGDPKQSIYRFRRADIAQYMQAADQVGADTEILSANFRSSRPVLDWVNTVFGELITEQTDAQPAYQALAPGRRHFLDDGSVVVFGLGEHDDLGRSKADEIRRREAADAADAVATALVDGWQVTEERDDGEVELRPCRPGDITVLLPARTSLPALESALDARGVPFRAENSSVVYATTEIRHLMLALRAAADPTDELALVAALRTPLYGCSDVELYEWKAAGGRWTVWWRPDEDTPTELVDHPVGEALQHLGTIARRASRVGPADLLAALVDERRVLDVALDRPDARDVWRRVRYVVDQARAWSDAGGHGLRRYLAWVHLLASESRNADTILPEHDDDAVRIMTVHAAKGLEFPITVLSGMTTKPYATKSNAVVWHQDTWTISNSATPDPIFEDFIPLDEQMSDAERRRLLYVACTRAVDHLVVSLHRYPDSKPGETAESGRLLFAHGAADAGSGARPLVPTGERFVFDRPDAPALEWPEYEAWETERRRAITAARVRPSVSATYLAGEADTDPGLDKGAVDLDLPPWQRGRYGTAVGRAVHAVLQYADLRTGADIDAEAAAQCAAEGIVGMDATVADLARSAIAAPIVQRALELPHHRELFVAAPVGDRTVEGYLDLFVETPDGGIIVDYKTDQWPDDPTGDVRADRVARYRRQLAVYGVVVEQLLGSPVEGAMLVRCRPDGPAEEIAIDRWAEALDEARSLIAVTV